MDELEKQISALKAERDVARHELAEKSKLLDEIRAAVAKPTDAQGIVTWLIARLQHNPTGGR